MKKRLLTSVVYLLIVSFCSIGLVACVDFGNNSERTYTVTFVAEDGTTVVGTDTYTENDKNINEPMVPEKNGYIGIWESYLLTTGNVRVRPVYTVDNLIIQPELSPDGNHNVLVVIGTTDLNPKNIIIPSYYRGEAVTVIGDHAFANCKRLKSVTIGNNVSIIREGAFENCSELSNVTIPNSTTYIGDSAFSGCSYLFSITIPDKVIFIGDSAFSGCANLNYIELSNGLRSIGDSVFYYCRSLKSITLPDNVTSIGDSAFFNCDFLTSITIPNSVTSIGQSAFSRCDRLTSITFKGTKEQWNQIRKGGLTGGIGNTGNYTITCTDGTIS